MKRWQKWVIWGGVVLLGVVVLSLLPSPTGPERAGLDSAKARVETLLVRIPVVDTVYRNRIVREVREHEAAEARVDTVLDSDTTTVCASLRLRLASALATERSLDSIVHRSYEEYIDTLKTQRDSLGREATNALTLAQRYLDRDQRLTLGIGAGVNTQLQPQLVFGVSYRIARLPRLPRFLR
ncbi:MAG: hypothetical protein A2Y38_16690 [Spirochaetes bacterium GWB1_59_5]|nr:MAG: hypothetical protein A2Y38_16690 [Spirochaetes bacterium GWB1_59_5]